MKKSTINNLKRVFVSIFGREPKKTQWNVNQQVVEGNELRFLKKAYKNYNKKGRNKMEEFSQYLRAKLI